MAQVAEIGIEKYQIARELGRGATSIVYLAHDTFNDRTELRVGQEIAGEKERGFPPASPEVAQDQVGAFSELVSREDQSQPAGARRTAHDGLIRISQPRERRSAGRADRFSSSASPLASRPWWRLAASRCS